MTKTRVAVAVAAAVGSVAMGALSSNAFAQTSSVQIGGSLNMFYGRAIADNQGAGVYTSGKNHDNLSLSEPEMYIHGEEKVGGGNTVWFRCTSSFDLMGTSAQNTTGAGQLCGRNSALGFKGSFGNVFAGTWDTPQKLVGNQIRGWFGGTAALTGGFANALLGGAGSNTGNTGGTFWERRARSINYHSPSFGGMSVKAMYSAQNEATALTSATTQNIDPRTMGASLDWAQGPMYFGVGYERHENFNAGGVAAASLGAGNGRYNGGTDENWMLGARYQLGATRLSGLWTRSEYEVLNDAQVKKSGWAVFVDHQLAGPHSLKFQYFKAADTKTSGTTGAIANGTKIGSHTVDSRGQTGAKGWTAAYMYALSKRTEAGLVYGLIDNETNASYSKGVATATANATQKFYGLNVRHRF